MTTTTTTINSRLSSLRKYQVHVLPSIMMHQVEHQRRLCHRHHPNHRHPVVLPSSSSTMTMTMMTRNNPINSRRKRQDQEQASSSLPLPSHLLDSYMVIGAKSSFSTTTTMRSYSSSSSSLLGRGGGSGSFWNRGSAQQQLLLLLGGQPVPPTITHVRLFSSSTTFDSKVSNKDNTQKDTTTTSTDPTTESSSSSCESTKNELEWVYQSPFGSTVLRLRILSLVSGVAGVVGLPVAMAVKQSHGDVTSLGFWIICATFGLGTMTTTAAVSHIFRPYVYQIQRRLKHHHNKNNGNPSLLQEDENKTPEEKQEVTTTTTTRTMSPIATSPSTTSPYLYIATTRSLFLWKQEHVFDPETQLQGYTGFLHPLCNLVVVGHSPPLSSEPLQQPSQQSSQEQQQQQPIYLYVHPELASHDAALSQPLTTTATGVKNTTNTRTARRTTTTMKNPDTDILRNKRRRPPKQTTL